MRRAFTSISILLFSLPLFAQVTSPFVVESIPAAGATGVPLNGAVLVRTNRPINISFPMIRRVGGTVNLSLREVGYLTDNATYFDRIFAPFSNLEANAQYEVSLTASGGGVFHQFRFTTGTALDATPPALVSVSPASGAQRIDPFAPIQLRFSEPVTFNYFEVGFRNSAQQQVAQAVLRILSDRQTVEVLPRWQFGVVPDVMELEFPFAQIRDYAGNAMTGGPVTYRWTTLLADAYAAPRVLGQYPKAGETGVPTNAAVQVLFDQPIQEFNNSLRASVETMGGVSSGARATVRTTPLGSLLLLEGAALAPGTTYRARVSAARNAVGQNLAEPLDFQFTTGTGPEAVVGDWIGTGPLPGAPVATNTKFIFRSPRRLPEFVTLLASALAPSDSGGFTSPRGTATATLAPDQRLLVITPDQPLPANTQFSLGLALFDITGAALGQGLFGVTNDQVDTTPPAITGSNPVAGAMDFLPTAPIRVAFSESLGALTPPDALRLTRGGESVAGRASLEQTFGSTLRTLDFVPAQRLEPDTDYELVVSGVTDAAGNTMEPVTIRFRTGALLTTRPPATRLLRANFEGRTLGPEEAAEMEFSAPLSAGHLRLSVTVPLPRDPFSSSPSAVNLPFRAEVAGAVVRAVPTAPWPSGINVAINVNSLDAFGGFFDVSTVFRVGPSSDDQAPRVLSVTPAPGTPQTSADVVRIEFSEPISEFSAQADALMQSDSVVSTRPNVTWSEGGRVATIRRDLPNYSPPQRASHYSLHLSRKMTDLAGNPLAPVTYVWPRGDVNRTTTHGAVVRVWPPPAGPSGGSVLSGRMPITLLLARPVSSEDLNRNVWVISQRGRVPGTWSSEGSLITFRPLLASWPEGDSISLYQLRRVFDGNFGATTPAAPPASSTLRIVRTSLSGLSQYPLGAPIDVEFDREPPANAVEILLRPTGSFTTIAPTTSTVVRLRPNVFRYVVTGPAVVGGAVSLRLRGADGALESAIPEVRIVAAPARPVRLEQYSPLAGATAARNAGIGIRLSGPVNVMSLQAMKVTADGADVPFRANFDRAGTGQIVLQPEIVLPAASEIRVTLGDWEDGLGNRLAPLGWAFRTSDQIDLEAPSVYTTNLPRGQNPALNPDQPVVFTFEEPLDAARSLTDIVTGGRNTPAATFDASLQQVTLTPPDQGWNRGEDYIFRLNTLDWAGNFGGAEVSFRVNFDQQPSNAEVEALSPGAGMTDVPVNTAIGVLLTRTPLAGLPGEVRLTRGDGENVPLTRQLSEGGRRLSLLPAYLLQPNTEYELVYSVNVAGIPVGQRARFTTGGEADGTPATVRYTIGGADEPMIASFSEPMDVTSLPQTPLTWLDMRGNSGFNRTLPVRAVWSSDRRELTLTPLEPLRVGLEHNLNLAGLLDLANSRSSVGGFPVQRFTPGTTPPGGPPPAPAITITPPNGSTNVPTNALTHVLLGQNTTSTPEVRVFRDDVAMTASIQPSLGLIRLSFPLEPNRRYRIEVSPFVDDQRRSVAGATSSFTTGAQGDGAGLRLLSASPATGAVNVPVDAPWEWTFDKLLYPQFIPDFGPQSSRNLPARYRTEFAGDRLRHIPVEAWPAASTIQWSIFPVHRGGFNTLQTLAGARLNSQFTVTMRTAAVSDATPPVLEEVTPPPGTLLGGDRTNVIRLRFSEPVEIPNNGLQIFVGADLREPFGTWSEDRRTLTLNVMGVPNSRITIVGFDTIRDNAQNPIAPFSIEYPTGEAAPFGPPRAELLEPRGNDVPANTPIRVQFDRRMDVPSVLSGIRVTQNGLNITGTVSVESDSRTFRFRPDLNFAAGALVRVFLLDSIRDQEGIAPQFDFYSRNFVFTIAGGPRLPERVWQIARRAFRSAVPADGVLEVEFNAPLDAASVSEESVWLHQGGALVAGTASVRDGSILRFVPAQPLVPGLAYILTAGAALRAADGRAFAGEDLRFRAAAPQAPLAIERIDAIEWEGRAAYRVRLTGALSPLSLSEVRLLQGKSRVAAEVLATLDPREVVIVPAGAPARFTLSLDDVMDAAGRPVRVPRRELSERP